MIYMDYSATTYVKSEVLKEMLPFFQEKFGNPSSVHQAGRAARAAVDQARERCASALKATPREIYFTSGGTEADNLAIRGAVLANESKGKHLITSTIEHHAVLHTFQKLEQQGFAVTYVPVTADGIVDVATFAAALRPDTVFASIMTANNEIGTLQPIGEIGALCRQNGTIFHTDAVQAFGHCDLPMDNIDMLSLSAHKIYGPKGIGLLYAKKGTAFSPITSGGSHEYNRRPGTENVPGIVGLGKAMTLTQDNQKLLSLRSQLVDGILDSVPFARLNGSRKDRLPGNANFCFPGVSGATLLQNLDLSGICISAGSACTTGSIDPSHVLLAIGLTEADAKSSLRFSLGDGNTKQEVQTVIDTVTALLKRLQSK